MNPSAVPNCDITTVASGTTLRVISSALFRTSSMAARDDPTWPLMVMAIMPWSFLGNMSWPARTTK